MLGLYASIYFALGITVGLILYLKSLPKNKIIQWNYLIDVEKLRLMRKYSFFNLFTDVPQIKKKAKRRKYLDWLIPKFKNVYGYLFIRARKAPESSRFWIAIYTAMVARKALIINKANRMLLNSLPLLLV